VEFYTCLFLVRGFNCPVRDPPHRTSSFTLLRYLHEHATIANRQIGNWIFHTDSKWVKISTASCCENFSHNSFKILSARSTEIGWLIRLRLLFRCFFSLPFSNKHPLPLPLSDPEIGIVIPPLLKRGGGGLVCFGEIKAKSTPVNKL